MGQGYNTGSDYMTALSNTNSDLRTLTGYEYTDRNAAWYFNADYAYRHRYFFNVGMSLETSSRFGREAGGLDLCGVSWGLVGFIGKVHAECGFYQQSQSPCGLYDVGQR